MGLDWVCFGKAPKLEVSNKRLAEEVVSTFSSFQLEIPTLAPK
jgi:hypothetical protein